MTTPNPGSSAAVSQGCICPVLDNNHGAGFPWPGVSGPSHYISDGCPLHAPETAANAPGSSSDPAGDSEAM